jgi:hypothetical protein
MREPIDSAWKRGEDKPRIVDVVVGDGERTMRRREDGGCDAGADVELSVTLGVLEGSPGVSEIRTSCHPSSVL